MRDYLEQIECDRCDYKHIVSESALFSSHWIEHVYLTGDKKRFPLTSDYLWCNECCGFSNCEVIPSLPEVEKKLDYLRSVTIRRPSWYSNEKISHSKDMIAAEIIWKQWSSTRKAPRCLSCGSIDLGEINLSNLKANTGSVTHPSCGGVLSYGIIDFDIRSSPRYPNNGVPVSYIEYDLDGMPTPSRISKILMDEDEERKADRQAIIDYANKLMSGIKEDNYLELLPKKWGVRDEAICIIRAEIFVLCGGVQPLQRAKRTELSSDDALLIRFLVHYYNKSEMSDLYPYHLRIIGLEELIMRQ